MYILRCSDNTLYVGSTNNLERRMNQHHLGEGSRYTKSRQPVELIYIEEFSRIDEAFNREKQLKKWSRKKKLALIKKNEKRLKYCAECKNESHFKNKGKE